jgi:hypothetical protein
MVCDSFGANSLDSSFYQLAEYDYLELLRSL